MDKKQFYQTIVSFVKMFGAESTSPASSDPSWFLSIRTQEPVYSKAIGEDLVFTERKIAELTHKFLERQPDDKNTVSERWWSTSDDFDEGFLPEGILGVSITLPGIDYDKTMGRDSLANPKLVNGDVVTAYPRDVKIVVCSTKCTPHPSK